MPFIKLGRREVIATHGLNGLEKIEPGDRCYVFYKSMVEDWKKEPRWSTAHKILADFFHHSQNMQQEDMIACRLAWEVFFQLYVMPYELKKREENGDV